MKHRKFLYLALVTFLLACVPSLVAQSTPKSAIFYKISGKKLKKPSYIFGTMHLLCEKDFPAPQKLGRYLVQTKRVMLEIDMNDPELRKKSASRAMLADGKILKDYLTSEEFTKLDDIFKSYLGISFELLQRMKPIYASVSLLMSPKITGCQQPMMLDDVLAKVAAETKIPVTGLETIEKQIQLVDKTPMSEQIKALKELASDPEKNINQFKTLYKTYLNQDSDALFILIASEMRAAGSSQNDFLDNRNINWIPLIEKQINVAPTFIGVGAGHLGGENGVVKLLRKKGYTLTPIRL